MKISVKPTGTWMLCRIERPNKTKGGLHIPVQAQDSSPGKALIVERGSGCEREDLDVGTEIVLDPRTTVLDFSGLELDGFDDFFMTQEHSVAAIVERD